MFASERVGFERECLGLALARDLPEGSTVAAPYA